MPPYELPSAATQSGIKSRSSKHGTAEHFNEIRFEDKKGAEEVYVHAEKDMSTVVEDCQPLAVGKNRKVVVGHDESNWVKANRDLTVDANDSVVIGGNHDKTVTGRVVQIYGGDHSRKVDGDQDLVEEQNKDEHVKQAYTLTTDKKFQLVQDATSMTFKRNNVTLSAGGEVAVLAGGATFSMDTKGTTTFDGPGGVKLVCGASSLAVSAGGVALASPNITMAVGASSVMAMGSGGVSMNGRQVHIEAASVCNIKGPKKIKLQESKSSKGKQKSKSTVGAESEAAAKAKEATASKQPMDSLLIRLQLHSEDHRFCPNVAYVLTLPSGQVFRGTTDPQGWLECLPSGACEECHIEYWPNGGQGRSVKAEVLLEKPGDDSEQSLLNHLRNLGFAKEVEHDRETVLRYQEHAGLVASGYLDEQTKASIKKAIRDGDESVKAELEDDD